MLAAGLALSACGAEQPLVYDVTVEPAAISPNGDGVSDVAMISYEIGAPAALTITLQSDAGSYTLRSNRTRSPGHHEALFGGTIDGRMLPNGTYVVRVEARPLAEKQPGDPGAAGDDRAADGVGSSNGADSSAGGVGSSTDVDSSADGVGGERVVQEARLVIADADPSGPQLLGFEVHPDSLTPNQDGISDRVRISYRLEETANVEVWLESADGRRVMDILEEEQSATLAGEPGPHQYDFDAGVDADAPPPPDGQYYVVASASDAVGNVTTERRPLSIADGGQPRAALFGDVEWSTTIVPLGGTLAFTTTVRNVGSTPIRTRGPEPGFTYLSSESFNQPAPDELVVIAEQNGERGTAHVPIGQASDYTTTVEIGRDAEPRSRTADPDGLIASVGIARPTRARVCGSVARSGVAVDSAKVYAFEADGDGVSSTLSDSTGHFCLENLRVPTPVEQTYARSSGAIRLGMMYTDRTGLAWPFRWQLGRTAELSICETGEAFYLCLPPGREVRVHGAIRFDEPPLRRDVDAYLGLLHEDVREMHSPFGNESITFEY